MPIAVKFFDTLRRLALDAGGALSRERQPRLFDRLDWFELTARLSPPEGRFCGLRADDRKTRLWLMLADRGRGHGEAYATWYTLGFAPIWSAEAPWDEKLALATAAARKLRRRFASITLSPIGEADRALLEEAFRRAGWGAVSHAATANWVARTDGLDGDGYWDKRPSRLRNTVKRKARGSDIAVEVHERFSPGAWADYEAVYAKSWKPAEGSPSFLRTLAEAEGAAGTLRLGIARQVGQPVAAQFWLVENGRATIHKLAYVEAAKESSPGTVLSEKMFRHVIDRDQPELIDFGTGDDAYKADWMDERRQLWRLELYNRRSVRGLMRDSRRRIAGLVRRRAND